MQQSIAALQGLHGCAVEFVTYVRQGNLECLSSRLAQGILLGEIRFYNSRHSQENQLARLFHFDLFHCFHLGLAKNYLGSMIALLSQREPGTSIDTRFEQLTAKYLGWCCTNGRPAHVQRLTKEMINWVSTTVYPTGGWHKGDLSTSLLLWVESRFLSEDWSDDDLLFLGG